MSVTNYNIDFEICSIFFLLIPALSRKKNNGKKDIYTFQFKSFLFYAFICGVIEVWSLIMLNYPKHHTDRGIACAYACSLVLMSVIPSVVIFFVHGRLFFARKKNAARYYFVNLLPIFIADVVILQSPFNGLAFCVEDGVITNTYFIFVIPAEILVYLIWAYAFLISNAKFADKDTVLTVTCLGICFLLPWVTVYFFPNIPLFITFITVASFIMYRSYENNSTFIDTVSGALNRDAFTSRYAGKSPKRENIFVIALDNFKIVNEMYGIEGGNYLMHEMVKDFQEEFGKKSVYRFNGDIFTIIVPDSEEEATKSLKTIRRLLMKNYRINDTETTLSACICLVHSELHNADGIIASIEYAVSQAKSAGKGQFFEVKEGSANALTRRKAIEQAIMDNINKNTFEVHYQPIYDTHKKRFHSMEALARLNVPGYGYVSPEEFIKIAEKNGTVVKIGILVLEEVCKFINESDLKSKGIKFVEVNLSVVQCMQKRIFYDIRDVLNKYNIPPEMINLEITESAAAYSEKRLIRNMARLSLMNISFSLDDYGSGYSNINYLVKLPFFIAKIDKYVVWAAVKSVKSKTLLENTIAMFKKINLKVVTEGIEDREMAEEVIEMGADYIQGYYFSKPVPKDKLLERLEDGYLEKLIN